MNIKANEVLLLDRKYNNMKQNLHVSPESQEEQAPVSNPQAIMNAMAIQGQNNMAFQGGLSGVRRIAKIPLLIAGLATTSAGMTSCIKQEQEINIDLSMLTEMIASFRQQIENLESHLQSLDENGRAQLALLRQMLLVLEQIRDNQETANAQAAQRFEQLFALISTISGQLDGMSSDLAEYFLILFGKLDTMNANQIAGFNMVVQNQNLQRQQDQEYMMSVIQILTSMDSRDALTRQTVLQILDKLGQIYIQNEGMISALDTSIPLLNALLQVAINMRDNQVYQLDATNRIYDKLDSMDVNMQIMQTTYLNRLDTIINNQEIDQSQRAAAYALGVQILAAIPANGTAANYEAALDEIIGLLGSINGRLASFLPLIVQNQQDLSVAMTNGIATLMANDDANTAAIISAMESNRAALALTVVGASDSINATLTNNKNEIIAAIQASSSAFVDAVGDLGDDLIPHIMDIKANQTTLISGQTEIRNELVNYTRPLLGAILDRIPSEFNDSTLVAKLQDIYNRIPDGCSCVHNNVTIDFTLLYEKLDRIADLIQNNNGGSGNNEGQGGDGGIDLGELD